MGPTAFQKTAFQNNAFQIATSAGSGGGFQTYFVSNTSRLMNRRGG